MKSETSPTRKARRNIPGGSEPVPATEAPTTDVRREGRTDEQLDPRLPHERDEVARAETGEHRGRIKQAHEDLAAGQADTDCRNSTEEKIEEKSGTALRHKP